jgi:hypothetical protein
MKVKKLAEKGFNLKFILFFFTSHNPSKLPVHDLTLGRENIPALVS